MEVRLVSLVGLLASGCAGKSATDSTLYEGDVAGECSDGADNDRDGYFDCADNSCWGAPECAGDSDSGNTDSGDSGSADDTGETGQDSAADSASDSGVDSGADTGGDSAADTGADSGVDSGADTSSDTGGDTGTATAVAADLMTFTLTYSLQWDFYDKYDSVIEGWGLRDCTADYAASGTQVSADGDSVTFDGAWTLTGGDCPDAQTDPSSVVWYNKTSGEAYATFTFSDDLSTLNDWIEHKNLTDTTPLDSPTEHFQWYITDMAVAYDGSTSTATYTAVESTTIEGLIPLDLTHTMTVTFGE